MLPHHPLFFPHYLPTFPYPPTLPRYLLVSFSPLFFIPIHIRLLPSLTTLIPRTPHPLPCLPTPLCFSYPFRTCPTLLATTRVTIQDGPRGAGASPRSASKHRDRSCCPKFFGLKMSWQQRDPLGDSPTRVIGTMQDAAEPVGIFAADDVEFVATIRWRNFRRYDARCRWCCGRRNDAGFKQNLRRRKTDHNARKKRWAGL